MTRRALVTGALVILVASLMAAPRSARCREVRLAADLESPRSLVLAWCPEVADVLLAMAAAAPPGVQVMLLVAPRAVPAAQYTFRSAGLRVRVIEMPVRTPWVRDYGPQPIVTSDGEVVFLAPRYDRRRPDEDRSPCLLARALGIPCRPLDLRLDGGNLIARDGLCLSTPRLSEQNENLGEAELRARLAQELGCRHSLFLPRLRGEPTGHVDVMVSFVAGRVVVAEAAASAPRDAGLLEAVADRLLAELSADGPPRPLVRVPLVRDERQRPLSYAQLLRVGARLLVPDYVDRNSLPRVREAQQTAFERLRREFDGLTIVPIPLAGQRDLAGGVHCYGLVL